MSGSAGRFRKYKGLQVINADTRVSEVAALGTDKIVSGHYNGTIKIWNTSGTLIRSWQGGVGVVTLAIIRNEVIVTGFNDGIIKIWRVNGDLVKTIGDQTAEAVGCLVIRNEVIVSGYFDGSVKIWSMEGTLINFWKAHDDAVTSIATLEFTNNTDDLFYIVTGGAEDDPTVKLWTWGEGFVSLQEIFKSHIDAVLSIVIIGNEGNKRIVSCSADQSINIYSIGRSRPIKTIYEAHTDVIFSMTVLGTDRIVSCSADRTIKIWSNDGTSLQTLQNHDDEINALATLGTNLIVSGSDDKTIRIWGPKPKFKVGDEVFKRLSLEMDFNVNDRHEITERHWFWESSTWRYLLTDEDGNETGFSSEEYLRIAPKFKVGDKVLWLSGNRRNRGVTFEVTDVEWVPNLESWSYKLRDEFGTPRGHTTVESELSRADDESKEDDDSEDRPAPSEDEENLNKRKRDSEQVQQEKKKYRAEPLTRESDCAICSDPLLGPVNKLEDGKVINVGLDRNAEDDKGNVIGKEKFDEIVIMYCCGNGFHKRCIDKALQPTKVENNLWDGTLDKARKCPLCAEDLSAKLDAGKPVYRHAEVVKSGKETVEVETVTAIRFCKLTLKF